MTAPVRVSQLIDGDQFKVSIVFEPSRVVIDTKRGLEVLLDPMEAGLLDSELYAAASPPDPCDDPGCAMYAVVSIGGRNLCQAHHAAFEAAL